MIEFERVFNTGPVHSLQMESEVFPKKTSTMGTKEKTKVVANASMTTSLVCQSKKSPKQIVVQKPPFPSNSEISEEFEFYVDSVLKNNPAYTRKMAEDFVKSHY